MTEPVSAGGALLMLTVIWLGLIAIFAMPLYRIFKRAGLGPAWVGLTALPFLGVLALIGILAFQDWPNEPEGYR